MYKIYFTLDLIHSGNTTTYNKLNKFIFEIKLNVLCVVIQLEADISNISIFSTNIFMTEKENKILFCEQGICKSCINFI